MTSESVAGRPACLSAQTAFDTVILAGGQASRMGGADKAALVVGHGPMLTSVARAAAAAGSSRLIIVGPPRAAVASGLADLGQLTIVREDPPGGGPVPALRRGLAEVSAPWLMLLAADLPFLGAALIGQLLAGAAQAGSAGAVLADDTGQLQWLAGCWETSRVRSAAARYGGRSLHGLLRPLAPVPVRPAGRPAPGIAPWLDCDTPADLAAARQAWAAHHGRSGPDGER